LLQGYSGWTADDEAAFKNWLATEVYKKTDWASDTKSNNWGSAGSYMSTVIADYLAGSGILMRDRNGATITSHDAYAEHRQRMIDRMNGNTYMTYPGCKQVGVGIRPDGGIPEELVRGTTGCDGLWFAALDGSWTYMITHLAPVIAHAELLWRRGDPSGYTNITQSGAGNILMAVYFFIHNANDVTKSVDYKANRKQPLEFLYRFLATQGSLDPYLAKQLGIGGTRYIGGDQSQTPQFGTITHGFAVGEIVTPPPTVPEP
jgi:hypothetical protein